MFQTIRTWSIRTIKEFDGLQAKSTKWVLYKDEQERVIELDIVELRKLKEFFDEWVDPFKSDNPLHSDKQK